MNIGIIVYSQTGNTRAVAERLKEKLAAAGHTVTIDPVTVAGEAKPGSSIQFTSAPDTGSYEGVIFASPVQGFSLAPAMKAYLKTLGSLQGKKTACFITKHLKNTWTGGRGSLKAIQNAVEENGGNFLGSGYVFWSSPDREAMIDKTVEELVRLF